MLLLFLNGSIFINTMSLAYKFPLKHLFIIIYFHLSGLSRIFYNDLFPQLRLKLAYLIFKFHRLN